MARTTILLDENWKFNRGDLPNKRPNSHSTSYSICKAGNEDGPAGFFYDDSNWEKVDLPHDYLASADFSENNLISHGYRTRTNAWYRKSFYIPEEWRGKQFFLCFEGTAVNARFYLNGSLMDRSFSAYTESAFDITPRIHFGEKPNVLSVYIIGFETEGWWYEGAGIYRHVRLYIKDSLHVAHNGVFAKPVLEKGSENDWNVAVEALLENSAWEGSQTGAVCAELYNGEQKVASAVSAGKRIPPCEAKAVRLSLPIKNPERWDVNNPKLYTVRVTVLKNGEETDEVTERIGFRTIATDPNKGFFLNGRQLRLLGTCNHQDHAGIGVALPDSVIYYRVKRLKELGSNAYRCSHNLPNKELLDACDELGMIVMDENRRFETREEVLRNLEVMVRRDRNHPSVVFWSLFNEEPLQNLEEGASIYRRMRNLVLKLDNSRILTGAINGNMEGAGQYMDVTGINYHIHQLEDYHKKYPQKCIIGSENNSAVTTRGCYLTDHGTHVLANYDEEKVPWGETIRETWDVVRKNEFIAGIFIWTGFDYRGEPTPYEWPSVSSQFGIMDTCGFAKDSFYYNKACFVKEPLVHLLPHWNWKEGEKIRVAVPTNCDEVEVILNGRSLGKKPGDCVKTPEWEVEFQPGTIRAVGYRNKKVVAFDEETTAGKPYAIRLEADRLSLTGDGQDTVPIHVYVVDKAGIAVPTANNHICFETEGDGFIRGVGNGDPNSHESDVLPERNLYFGHAQALVTARRDGKKIFFRATGEGLKSAELTFEVKKVAYLPTLRTPGDSIEIYSFYISKAFAERPDPLQVYADNDMNSLDAIDTVGMLQCGFNNGYRIYRVKTKLPAAGKQFMLCLAKLRYDALEIYENGQRLFATDQRFDNEDNDIKFAPLPLHAKAGEEVELRFLVRVKGDNNTWGGFRDGLHITWQK